MVHWQDGGAAGRRGHDPALGVRLDAPVLDYDWELSLQPEDGAEADVAGCWMVDGVMPDASPREVWEQGLSEDGENKE